MKNKLRLNSKKLDIFLWQYYKVIDFYKNVASIISQTGSNRIINELVR